MLPKYHIILGAIFATLVYFIFSITLLQAIIIFLTSSLVDIDHYLYYILKRKNLNISKAFKWFSKKRKKQIKTPIKEREKFKYELLLFHGIEFLIILLFLSLINKLFLYILIGASFHILLDYIEIIYYRLPLYPKVSQLYVLLKDKDKKDILEFIGFDD